MASYLIIEWELGDINGARGVIDPVREPVHGSVRVNHGQGAALEALRTRPDEESRKSETTILLQLRAPLTVLFRRIGPFIFILGPNGKRLEVGGPDLQLREVTVRPGLRGSLRVPEDLKLSLCLSLHL